MPEMIGRKLGKYELVERLGRGGMAEVYKAYQPGVERHVAIKVMHGHLSDNPELVQRFQREARSIGQLQHAHIGRVIDFDVEADVSYMVMEYIQGGTLDSYLKQKKVLPVDEAVRITLHLADALAYAHQRGMIHRDIKPGNILFSDESHNHALLTDFGIARLLDEQKQMTMTGALIGTPNYMSPEAARGEPCDARADIYSLGVVLYEMVTGRTPYAADTPYSFLMKQANEPLPPPRTLNPKLPVALEAIILKALAKEPAARYQSATDFATALRMAQAVADSTATGPLPMAHPKRSTRTGLALAAVGVIAIALITVFALLSLDSGAPSTQLEPTVTAEQVAAVATATTAPAQTTELTSSTATTSRAITTTPLTTTLVTTATTTLSDSAALMTSAVDSGSAPLTSTAILTGATPITATVAPTTTLATTATRPATATMLAATPLGTLHFVDTDAIRAGGFQLTLNQMRLPPADYHYELWLVGDGDVAQKLGTPTVEQGRIRYQGESDQSLLAGYSRAELRVVPDNGDGTGEVILVSSQPPVLVAALRDLLTGDSATSAGLLPNANAQFAIALQHGGFLAEALTAANLDEARRHAEHIVNILDGADGVHFGDLNGDGQAQNPGDGYGVRTYLTDAATTVETLLTTITQTTSLPFYGGRVVAAQQNSLDALTAAIESVLKVFAADTVEEAQPFAAVVNTQLAALLAGRDLDENGVLDPLRDEGGLRAAHEYALRLADYAFTNPTAAQTTIAAPQPPVGFLRFSDGAPLTTTATADAGYGDYGSDSYGSSNDSTTNAPDGPVPASRFTLELNHLPLPPAGSQYVVWLGNDEGEEHALGALPLSASVVLTGATNENLLLDYNRVVITSEPIGDLPASRGEQIRFSGEHTTAFMTPFRTALFVSEPYQTGLLSGARRQMTIAIAHSGFLEDALDDNLDEARRHAEHIINVIEGKTGQHFGDLDGDGMAQDPGDGFGVRPYLAAAREAMAQATAAMTATADSRFFAERYLAANDHTLVLLEKAYEKALQIFAADSADEARPFATELRVLLDAALNGEDVDGNGVVDPLADEGGILVLYEAGLLLGEFAIYPNTAQ